MFVQDGVLSFIFQLTSLGEKGEMIHGRQSAPSNHAQQHGQQHWWPHSKQPSNKTQAIYKLLLSVPENALQTWIRQICPPSAIMWVRLTFFLILTSLYWFNVGVEGHCCTWSYSDTHKTLGRTVHYKGLAYRSDPYPITQNTYKRKTSMLPVGFEPVIPASERPQIHALDRMATGIRWVKFNCNLSN